MKPAICPQNKPTVYVLSDTRLLPTQRLWRENYRVHYACGTLCCHTTQNIGTKCPCPTLTRSQSHPDFTLGISYHSADFRILACTSDHNGWSSTGKRVKITLLQSKHIKDKKSHISFYHKKRTSLPILLGS